MKGQRQGGEEERDQDEGRISTSVQEGSRDRMKWKDEKKRNDGMEWKGLSV